MQIFSTVTALAFLASAVNALTITNPVAGTTISNPVTIQVNNDENETFDSVQVTFASACGTFSRAIPTNNAQTIYLPCDINGVTNIVASYSSGASANIQVVVNQAGALPYAGYPCGSPCGLPYPGVGCAGPCDLPCASPCYTPSALPPITLPAPCALPCGSPCGRLSRRSHRHSHRHSHRRSHRPCLSDCPTATPCDTLYFNPPVNMPLPECARTLGRCGRLYGEEAQDIQEFQAESVNNA